MVHRQHSHMSRAVNLDVVHRGEQDTAFQVLECGSEFDATWGRFTIACTGGILDRHGPSWAKRPTLPVISNALPEPATSTAERADV
jgi:hypothetical protein